MVQVILSYLIIYQVKILLPSQIVHPPLLLSTCHMLYENISIDNISDDAVFSIQK